MRSSTAPSTRTGERRDGEVPLRARPTRRAARGDGAFVWIGLHEPTEEEFDVGAARVRPARAGGRGRDQGAPAAEARGLRRHALPRAEDGPLPRRHRGRSSSARSCCSSARASSSPSATATPSWLDGVRRRVEATPELLEQRPGRRAARDHRPRRRRLLPGRCDGLEDDIEEVEEQVFSADRAQPGRADLQAQARGASSSTAPPRRCVEPLERLARGDFPAASTRRCTTYFRDVHDHLLRVDEQRRRASASCSTSVLEANLTQVSVRQNEDMRKISAWVAIIAVPTMIAGIYGMNFEHMPELEWEFGYPIALVVMARDLLGRCTATSRGSAGCRLRASWRTTTASSARSSRASCPSQSVDEDEHTVAFMDINPWTRGHALVIPREHSQNLYEIDDEDLRTRRAGGQAAGAAHEGPARLRRGEPAQLAASRRRGRRCSTSTCT